MRLHFGIMNGGRAATASSRAGLQTLMIGGLCGIAVMLFATAVPAATSSLQTRLEQFLTAQAADDGAQISVKVTMPDPRLGPCDTPQPFLPRRTNDLAGYVTVGVKCPGNLPVTRYFRAYISITTDYFVAAHLLDTGDRITLDDLTRKSGDITRMAPGVVTDAGKLLGKIADRRIPQGVPLTKHMVHTRKAVKRGDHVQIKVIGTGFTITTSGTALNSAPSGGQVRVRTKNGATVTGTIRGDNTVIIQP